MKLRVFTLRMNPATALFDDKELADFQLDKDVLEISEHFLIHEKTPTLVLILRYRELPAGERSSTEAVRKDWRAELDAQGQRIYDELRSWRGRKAKREGMPPYLILNNRELAELAMKRPSSLTQLREISGIGEAKAGRWGEEILAVLAKLTEAVQPSPKPEISSETGGGVIHGCYRASPFRSLGENPQRPFIQDGKISQTGSLHSFLQN